MLRRLQAADAEALEAVKEEIQRVEWNRAIKAAARIMERVGFMLTRA